MKYIGDLINKIPFLAIRIVFFASLFLAAIGVYITSELKNDEFMEKLKLSYKEELQATGYYSDEEIEKLLNGETFTEEYLDKKFSDIKRDQQ